MPGLLLTQTARVSCAHQGTAMPTVGTPRVTLGGVPAVLQTAPYTVAGCPFPPVSGGPCVTGTWTMGTTRVMSDHQPLASLSNAAVDSAAPSMVPMKAALAPRTVLRKTGRSG